jgi:hypothetical protein
MKYFESLPKIISRKDNISTIKTNLMARSSIIPTLLSNPLVFYSYDVQDEDTPEIIAYKYYGNVYRYWIVLFANQIINPQWDWPMRSNVFNDYIEKKYPNIDVYTTLDHYEKIVTTTDNETNTITTDVFTISAQEFNSITPEVINFKTDIIDCSVSTITRAVNVYEMEYEKNESKRNIKILNSDYVPQLEKELQNIFKK